MKAKKMNLEDIKIESFITDSKRINGGTGTGGFKICTITAFPGCTHEKYC